MDEFAVGLARCTVEDQTQEGEGFVVIRRGEIGREEPLESWPKLPGALLCGVLILESSDWGEPTGRQEKFCSHHQECKRCSIRSRRTLERHSVEVQGSLAIRSIGRIARFREIHLRDLVNPYDYQTCQDSANIQFCTIPLRGSPSMPTGDFLVRCRRVGFAGLQLGQIFRDGILEADVAL